MRGKDRYRIRWALLAGLVMGLVAMPWAFLGRPSFVGFSGFLTGTVVWWSVVKSPQHTGFLRGTLAGALTGLLSHVTFWLIYYLHVMITYEPPSRKPALEALVSVLLLFIPGVLIVGPVTAIVGAITGAVFVHVQSRRTHG